VGEFDEVIGMRKTFIKERSAKAGKEKVDVDDATLFYLNLKMAHLRPQELPPSTGRTKN